MIFIDTEVFQYDWLICVIDNEGKKSWWNDLEGFKSYYNDNKDELWIGYNSSNYDIPIMQCILCGLNPKGLNDWIIKDHKAPWTYSELLRNYKFITYDALVFSKSLKQLESYLGVDIHETDVSFDVDRPLTSLEKELTEKYCFDDVDNLIKVFFADTAPFKAHMSIIDAFNLPKDYFRYTKAKLASLVLNCQKNTYTDEWSIPIVECIKLEKYRYILDWFKHEVIENENENAKLETTVFGIPMVFGLGGLHGGKQVIREFNDNYICRHDDVRQSIPIYFH